MNELEAVILDRDGVINHDSNKYIKSAEEWQAIDGSLEAIARLTQRDIPVFIASNQSGIARGLFDYHDLNNMHKKLLAELAEYGGYINGFFFCPTLSGECRKPRPGLLHEIRARTQVNLESCVFIGDSLKDVEAALAVNAYPVLVRTGKGEMTVGSGELPTEVPVFTDLAEAVDWLISSLDD